MAYWTTLPVLSHNLLAQLNEPIRQFRPQEKAWPEYRRALIAIKANFPEELSIFELNPRSSTWKESTSFLMSNQKWLEVARKASEFPHLGYLPSDVDDADDQKLSGNNADHPARDNPPFANVHLLASGELRFLASCLAADVHLAIEQEESDRATTDLLALLGIVDHIREIPVLVNDLIAHQALLSFINTLAELLSRNPDVFDEAQLERLANRLKSVCNGDVRIRFTNEKFQVIDVIQRVYTDNGRGDGYYYAPGFCEYAGTKLETLEKLVLPFTTSAKSSRREVMELLERMTSASEQHYRLPLWEFRASGWSYTAELGDFATNDRYSVFNLFHINTDGLYFLGEYATQARDALLVVLDLVRYRRAKGEWPHRVDEIATTSARTIEIDRLSGKPLLYRLAQGRPILYSVGFDADDDHATPVLLDGANQDQRVLDVLRLANDAIGIANPETQREWTRTLEQSGGQSPDGDLILWTLTPVQHRPTAQ